MSPFSEEAPVVNTTPTSVSGMVGERDVKDLPLNGRSFDNLITLNPGAINYSSMKSANTSTSDGNTFSVAGRRPGDNLFLLNGIEYTGVEPACRHAGRRERRTAGNRRGSRIQRAYRHLRRRIRKASRRPGSVVTQSGTNALHGSLFEFLRNSALDAPGIFDQGTVPPFRRNQFGGALGGPLKKDRLFLFGNYEGLPAITGSQQCERGARRQARQGLLPNAAGVYTQVAESESGDAAVCGVVAAAERSGTAGERRCRRVPPRLQQPEATPFMKTSGRCERTTSARSGPAFGAYTIDDGNSVIPLADPLFASALQLSAQVASVEETHVFSPQF